MEAMTTSFSSSVPAQLENFIAYTGPPLAKKRPAKTSGSRPVFDSTHAQVGTTEGYHRRATILESSVNYGINAVGIPSGVAEAPATCGKIVTDDREPSDGSGNGWPHSWDDFLDGRCCALGHFDRLASVDSNPRSITVVSPPEPVFGSSLPCVAAPVSWSATSRTHSSQGALGAGNESELGSMVSSSSRALCTVTARGRGDSPIDRPSPEDHERIYGRPDQANSEDPRGGSPESDSDDDIVSWKPRRRRGRSSGIGRRNAQDTSSPARERPQSISSGALSSDSDESASLSSFRCDRREEALDSTKPRGGGKHNPAPGQHRHHRPTRKHELRLEARVNASLRRANRSTGRTKSNHLKVSSIAPTPLMSRPKRRFPPKTDAIVLSVHQHHPALAVANGVDSQSTWEVDRIVKSVPKHGKVFYKVKWKPTWEPAENLQDTAKEAIAEFHRGAGSR